MPCDACKAEAVKRIREMRRKRIVRGVCIYCGKEPPETDHWGCRPCLDVKRVKRNKRRPKPRPRKRGIQTHNDDDYY